MGCSYKITAIIVAILTIVLAGSNLYKLVKQTDEDIKRFICHHTKRDDHKDMLHRQHQEKVRSHTTVEEKESFEDKIKHGRDESDKKTDYQMKIQKENECRRGITPPQMKGFHMLTRMGIAASIFSLVSCGLVFLAITSDEDKNRQRRNLLLPYIITHLAIIAFEIFAEIFSAHLVQRIAVLPMILLSLSVLMIASYVAIMVGYFRSLGKISLDQSVKEAFDYAIMPEEKDASEA